MALVAYIILYLYGITRLFHDPDDAEVKSIIQQAVTAFEHQTFQREPFEKKQEIESLAQFLIKNSNDFFQFNPDEFYKYDHCLHLSVTSKSSIYTHVPIHLQDDFKNHLSKLNNLVTNITLCNKAYNSMNKEQPPRLTLFLKYSDSSDQPYVVAHSINYNESDIESSSPPKKLDEEMLKKRPLTSDLYYIIRVIPISPGD